MQALFKPVLYYIEFSNKVKTLHDLVAQTLHFSETTALL